MKRHTREHRKNIKIHYLYRDGCNGKSWVAIVLRADRTDEDYLHEIRRRALKALNRNIVFDDEQTGRFNPLQVGLPGAFRWSSFWDFWPEVDHGWHEMNVEHIVPTDEPPTHDLTVEELVRRMEHIKHHVGWFEQQVDLPPVKRECQVIGHTAVQGYIPLDSFYVCPQCGSSALTVHLAWNGGRWNLKGIVPDGSGQRYWFVIDDDDRNELEYYSYFEAQCSHCGTAIDIGQFDKYLHRIHTGLLCKEDGDDDSVEGPDTMSGLR